MAGAGHSRLIFALDVPSLEQAEPWVARLAPHVDYFKVGLELFSSVGPEAVRMVTRHGQAGVFLDLKLHDIPTTVGRAARVVRGLGVRMLTVHAQGGRAMLEAAARAALALFGEAGEDGPRFRLADSSMNQVALLNLAPMGLDPEIADNLTQVMAVRLKQVEGLYLLGGGRVVSEQVRDDWFDSSASAVGGSLDLGAGFLLSPVKMDVRITYSVFIGSANVRGLRVSGWHTCSSSL